MSIEAHYRIYDCEKGRWLPGLLTASGVRNALRLTVKSTSKIAYCAHMGTDIDNRYHIVSETMFTEISEEWDQTRMELLDIMRKPEVKRKIEKQREERELEVIETAWMKFEDRFALLWDRYRTQLLSI